MDNKKNLLPNEYFKGLKGKLKTSDLKELEEDMKTLISLIEDAKEIGQVALAREYEDLGITYLKERILFKSGITQYVYKEDIENYIKSVKKQVVKICEFENFPRTLPKEVVDKETEIMKAQVINEGKPENIADKIVQGKLKKFYSEVCLLDQEFVKDSDIKVRKLLENKNNDVTEFVRFEKGEGIEKKEENFAEEVMKQIK